MKKIIIIISQFVLCIFLTACGSNRKDYYEESIEDYKEIAYYALENYSAEDGSPVTVYLNDITDKELENSVLIAQEKFSYLWIENNSVVFWNDETKILGLVYSTDMKETIESIEDWYVDLDIEKIDKDIYLIGQFNSI